MATINITGSLDSSSSVVGELISYFDGRNNLTSASNLLGTLYRNFALISNSSFSSSIVGELTLTLAEYGNANAEQWYNLLQNEGRSAVARTYPVKTFNPVTNKTTLGKAIDYDVKVIPPYRNREGYQKEELITSGKGLTGIANYNLNFQVKEGLILIIEGKKWTVTGITDISDKTGILVYLFEIESGD